MAMRVVIAVTVAAAPLFHAPHAEDMPKQKPGESREKATIREVVADPVFGGEQDDTAWRYTGASAEEAHDGKTPSWIKDLQDLIELLSKALRVLVWIGGAVLLAALIYLSYRYRHAWLRPMRRRAAPPDYLFGLDVRPESLPDDVASAALLELQLENATAALSLLYRGALVSLIHRSQLDFHAGHTEDDCLRLARTAVDHGCGVYFGELLEAWKRVAYAHDAPARSGLEALCRRWPAHFALTGRTP